jgi:uncharacterized protein YegL
MQTTTQTTGSSTIALTPDLFALIDHAGALDQEIKALTKQLENLKTTIKANGAGDYLGLTYLAKVTNVNPADRIDWETIARKFDPSHQLITAHTTKTNATKRIGFELIK